MSIFNPFLFFLFRLRPALHCPFLFFTAVPFSHTIQPTFPSPSLSIPALPSFAFSFLLLFQLTFFLFLPFPALPCLSRGWSDFPMDIFPSGQSHFWTSPLLHSLSYFLPLTVVMLKIGKVKLDYFPAILAKVHKRIPPPKKKI